MPIQVTCPSCRSMFNAPDNAAGKRAKCPKCGGAIDIPTSAAEEEVYDAEVADEPQPERSIYDDEEFEVEPPVELPKLDDRKPCPMCGEMIQKDAVKCRYCGEVFDPLLRAQEKKRGASGEDADLSALDWVIAILCSGIGCILGIIYIVQGKPKGTKMLVVSLIVQFIWGMINVLAAVLTEQ